MWELEQMEGDIKVRISFFFVFLEFSFFLYSIRNCVDLKEPRMMRESNGRSENSDEKIALSPSCVLRAVAALAAPAVR